MDQFTMTIAGKGVDAMSKIAEDKGVPVRFGSYFELEDTVYCQVFSDTVTSARILRDTYNRDVRKLHEQGI